ncbi:MAG: hypothetical protein WCR06_03180 [bacterium]
MSKHILAGVAVLVFCAVFSANGAAATAAGGRSPEWNKNLKLAVNDAAKAAEAMQAMPEADRAAFAAEVLAALQAKGQRMADKTVWANDFAAIAAGLVAGSGGVKSAVLAAVAAGIGNACADPETRELTSGSVTLLGALAKGMESQLQGEDRVAFASVLLATLGKQKASDAAVHKQAMSMVALALFSGAGDAKDRVLAEIFAFVDIQDLGVVAQAFSNAFNQRNNGLDNDVYLQVAQQVLQKVAARLKGQPDAAKRFASAVAAFAGGAGNPAQFERDLLGKLADLLAGIGAAPDGFATALAAAKADMAADNALVKVLFLKPWVGPLRGFPFVHENRPPPGKYQNQ